MNKEKLFHRDFTLLVLGQIISLFGNSILRFALSLYVLDKTGSAAAFGGILAVSMIPTVILSPFGGVLADRVNRRNIMVILDFTTSALIAGFFLLFFRMDGIAPIAVTMVLLSIIQSFYQPSVQSSIPALAGDSQLERANGTVIQVNALANLLGPILGGMLYGFFGIRPILIASCVCFFASAVMELFLRIPFTPPARQGRVFAAISGDFREAVHFLVKDNPRLLRLLGVIAGLNLVLSALITVGLPYLVKVTLGLSSQLYGFAEAALALGSILGGVLSGVLASKVAFRRSHKFLLYAGLAFLPVGFAVLTARVPYVSYGIIVASVIASMCFATLFNVFAQSFAQRQTPSHLLGKVFSFITVISMCAFPVGQAMYGVLFDRVPLPSLIIFVACGASLLLALATGLALKGLPREEKAPAEKEPAPQEA